MIGNRFKSANMWSWLPPERGASWIISAVMSERRTAQIVGVVLGLIFAVTLILNALARF